MGLFIIIAVVIAFCTVFMKDGLLDEIKNVKKYNEKIDEKIKLKQINLSTKENRYYNKSDYNHILGDVIGWIVINIGLNVLNIFVITIITVLIIEICPYNSETQYSFNINALEDNMVTNGKFYGRRGYIDEELNYFFARTMEYGEKIGHIPADKTYIVYNEEVHPNIEVHKKGKDYPEWIRKMFFVEALGDQSYVDYYILAVPTGTISNMDNYEINMR